MPSIKKTRKRQNLDELTSVEWDYLLSGNDGFDNEINPGKVEEKWPVYRDHIMDLWLRFKPFDFGHGDYEENKPGTRPWGWWNLDHPEFKRECITGIPGYGEFNNGTPGYYSGPSVYESQAAFLKRKGLLTPKEILLFEEMPETEKIL